MCTCVRVHVGGACFVGQAWVPLYASVESILAWEGDRHHGSGGGFVTADPLLGSNGTTPRRGTPWYCWMTVKVQAPLRSSLILRGVSVGEGSLLPGGDESPGSPLSLL